MKEIRYPYVGNTLGFKLPEKHSVIHPIVETWDDFTNEQKDILLGIKNKILSVINEEYEIQIFGSRVKGYWNNKSDYDICIKGKFDSNIMSKLKNLDFNVKVDILFNRTELDKSIKIP